MIIYKEWFRQEKIVQLKDKYDEVLKKSIEKIWFIIFI